MTTDSNNEMRTIDELRDVNLNVINEFNQHVYGYSDVGERIHVALIAGGHVLLEGDPGLAKTHSLKVESCLISGVKLARLQGTPDMMPKDITGGQVFNPETRKMEPLWGEIADAHIVHFDESNRAIPGTQSALLAPMAEKILKVPGMGVRKLQKPFVAFFAQNSIEQEGTYPLPEAQKDRFMFWLDFGYPTREAMKKVAKNSQLADEDYYERIVPQMSLEDLRATNRAVFNTIFVHDDLHDYLLDIVRATVPGTKEFNRLCERVPSIASEMKLIKKGAGPRAVQALQRACQTRAFLFGRDASGARRDYVTPEDVKAYAHDVLRHRVALSDEAALLEVPVRTDQIIAHILKSTPVQEDASAFKR